MLRILRRKLHHLYSRIQWLLGKRLRPKVIIKRLRKANLRKWGNGTNLYPSADLNSFPTRPIQLATFNVALFSLAPAIQKTQESPLLTRPTCNNRNSNPKSILKQSPLHSSTGKKQRVYINLPENEISLAHSSMKFGENKDSVLMRSPVSLPSSLMAWWGQESFNNNSGSRSMAELLKEVDADILALQDVKAEEEKGMRPLSDLAAALGMKYVFAESWAPEYGNAILSKWPIKKWLVERIGEEDDFRNVIKATIEVPWGEEMNFYCTQLDHLDENWRLKQINSIIQGNDQSPHILLGCLNSLEASDYSTQRWKHIVKYYEEIGKPTPRVEVMRFLKRSGYWDAKEFGGECEAVVIIAKGQNVQGTCKYGTRVDYILASGDSAYKFVPGSYSVVSSKASSDHHIVKVKIVKDYETFKNKEQERKVSLKLQTL